MNCWHCNKELIWGGDFDYDDYGLEGEGIVSNLSCQNCSSYVEVYSPLNKEEDNDKRHNRHSGVCIGNADNDNNNNKDMEYMPMSPQKIKHTIEEHYPECTDELMKNFDKAYDLWLKKQSDYGSSNITLGLNISSTNPSLNPSLNTHNVILAQLGLVIRMNDKIQRLLNLYKKQIFKSTEVNQNESIEDNCIDIMNYANMLNAVRKGKWGK